ncbi:NLI interacting factor-like phosphatase [Trichinella nativa]|uniref:Mitochondrial import inner membrane translocase subunit TIM50 n=1 Tax=Trichinella nativa TaxID=6335 RepID=A0A1Y3EHL2_9BILA|nr:NLI interacting factor-like phosphatase [Trichinella nativa]
MFILNNPIIAQSDITGPFIGHCAIVDRFVLLDTTFGYPLRILGNDIFFHFAHFCHAETFVLHNSHFPFTDFICLFYLFWKLKTIKMNSNQMNHSEKKASERKKDNSSFHSSWFTPLPTIPEKSKKLYTAVLDLFYTAVRPCCAEFLESISEYYEVILFTAGTTRYAAAVIDQLIDPEHKYFSFYINVFFKIDNGILVEPWTGDEEDRELKNMIRFFHEIVDSNVEDVRPFLRERFQLYKIFED